MSPPPQSTARPWHAAITPALQGFKTYWPAMLSIQLIALGLVLGYYCIEGAARFFAEAAAWKARGGLPFAAVATVISGGIIPELIKRVCRPANVPAPGLVELTHQFTMWALIGILVDRFYHLQAILFGSGTDALTLLIKVLFDQFVFTPLISLPFITLWFMLHETGYVPQAYLAAMRPKIIRDRILQLWATCLCFWPVMLLIIYSLPGLLQFPLFLLGNAAYSILMIFIVRRQGEHSVDSQ